MRFGNWRGVTLAAAFVFALVVASTPARAQFHTIPRTVDAIDVNTGGPYMMPAIPSGHYAKDPVGKLSGHVGGLLGKLHGHGGIGTGCGACGGKGCGLCSGGMNSGCASCGDGGHGHGHGLFKNKGLGCGLCGGKGCGSCLGHATTAIVASPQGAPSAQAPIVMPSAQGVCVDKSCGLLGKHKHKGCGICGGLGKGCGSCAVADPCSSCGGKGCGLCGLGKGCGACGGMGCGLCKGGLGAAHGMINHLLGRDKIKWFNGPGGPVPLTPGYTPYINVTRSPRDFFAFPPFMQ